MTKSASRMDVLNGYGEIAQALGITVPQAKHRVAIGAIPIFRQGRAVCARMSHIAAHFDQLAKEVNNGERR